MYSDFQIEEYKSMKQKSIINYQCVRCLIERWNEVFERQTRGSHHVRNSRVTRHTSGSTRKCWPDTHGIDLLRLHSTRVRDTLFALKFDRNCDERTNYLPFYDSIIRLLTVFHAWSPTDLLRRRVSGKHCGSSLQSSLLVVAMPRDRLTGLKKKKIILNKRSIKSIV